MRRLWLVLLLCACGDGGVAVDGSEVGADVLRARTGDTTVWVNRLLRREDQGEGRTDLEIGGRTSRNITDGNVFVFDDPYGRFEQRSARTFELGFGTSELTSLIVGVPIFGRVHFAPSSNRPESLTSRIVVRSRLTDFEGSGMFLGSSPQVVSVGTRPVLRIEGTSNRGLLEVHATAAGIEITDINLASPRTFTVDLLMDHVIEMAGSGGRIEIRARSATGDLTKRASIELEVASFDLTAGDAYEVWPPAECRSEVAGCLAAIPAGETDLSSCGSYLEVRACPTGAIVDEAAFSAALGRAQARIESSTLRADAHALVGDDRIEGFLFNVGQSIESRLEQLFGAFFPSAGARDATLDAEIEAGFANAYVRPLDLVDPLAPIPNDPVRARHIAADALLLHLLTVDLTETEYGRPLEQLVREDRAGHLAALADLRDVGEILLSSGNEDILGTTWLSAHVEVTVDRTTGEAIHVLLEID